MEPGFAAVTTTPSMLPSGSELTVPVRAAWPCAQTVSGNSTTAALAASLDISVLRIGFSLKNFVFLAWLKAPPTARRDLPMSASTPTYTQRYRPPPPAVRHD